MILSPIGNIIEFHQYAEVVVAHQVYKPSAIKKKIKRKKENLSSYIVSYMFMV